MFSWCWKIDSSFTWNDGESVLRLNDSSLINQFQMVGAWLSAFMIRPSVLLIVFLFVFWLQIAIEPFISFLFFFFFFFFRSVFEIICVPRWFLRCSPFFFLRRWFLTKNKLIDLIKRTFVRENTQYLACNEECAFFTSDVYNNHNLWPNVCEALVYLLDNIFIRFGTKLYRQTIGIPMGTNCAPLVADLILFCYERDFM